MKKRQSSVSFSDPCWIALDKISMESGLSRNQILEALVMNHMLVQKETIWDLIGQNKKREVDVLIKYNDLLSKGMSEKDVLYTVNTCNILNFESFNMSDNDAGQ